MNYVQTQEQFVIQAGGNSEGSQACRQLLEMTDTNIDTNVEMARLMAVMLSFQSILEGHPECQKLIASLRVEYFRLAHIVQGPRQEFMQSNKDEAVALDEKRKQGLLGGGFGKNV
jgi:hypothetical protein